MPLPPEPTILDESRRLWWYEITEVEGTLAQGPKSKRVQVGDRMISQWSGRQGRWSVYDLRQDKETGFIIGKVDRPVTDEERAELKETREYHTVEVRT